MLSVDRTSPVPMYYQLAEQFETAIRSGALPAGTYLDNEVSLAKWLGLSRPTVRQALMYLSNKELVSRRRGHGTVVLQEKVSRRVGFTSLYDDLMRENRNPVTRVLRAEVVPASDVVIEALDLKANQSVLHLERVRYADEAPIALMHNFLPADLIQVSKSDLEEHGLYSLLRDAGVRLGEARQRISAKNASATEARLLDETRGAALVTMELVACDVSGKPVEFAQHVYRASRYSFSTTLAAQ
jgi:DNA-binding GntR family transcriptional regulator